MAGTRQDSSGARRALRAAGLMMIGDLRLVRRHEIRRFRSRPAIRREPRSLRPGHAERLHGPRRVRRRHSQINPAAQGDRQRASQPRRSTESRRAHDALTGLANRRLLPRAAGTALARSLPADRFARDADRPRPVQAGQRHPWPRGRKRGALRRRRSAARRSFRAGGTVARLGGDEFAALAAVAATSPRRSSNWRSR